MLLKKLRDTDTVDRRPGSGSGSMVGNQSATAEIRQAKKIERRKKKKERRKYRTKI